ncbi:thiopurine S-methyltransferase-like isoform 1-T2 [Rhinophrynus dorsalis]
MDSSTEQPELKISSEIKQDRVLTANDWVQRWENRNIAFHQDNIHQFLSEFLDTMLNNREQLNIFFPLCGKAVDMKWLAHMGHNIVGVDVSEIGLKEFFEESKIDYVEEAMTEIPGAKVFKSTSGNISLYCCNIFDLSDSLIGKFGGIWDRGAMVAMNPCDRERYTNLMLSFMAKDCRYLLVTLNYNPALIKGPPFYVSDADLERFLGPLCTIKHLKTVDAMTDKQKDWGLDYYYEKIHLITLKESS